MNSLLTGDVVALAISPRVPWGIVRDVRKGRVRVQLGTGSAWVSPWTLAWTGESLERVPLTRWGWARTGRALEQWKVSAGLGVPADTNGNLRE